MAELNLKSGAGSPRRFPLADKPLRIGRSRENDVSLPDQWLSRHHAEVHPGERGYYLRDLGSKNGTLLNDALLEGERLLSHGDRIRLGDHILVFSETADADEPEPEGTRVFSAKELSGVTTAPLVDAADVARQANLLKVLSKAVKTLVEHRPLAELFESILSLLFEAVPAERAAILLLEGRPPEPVVKASRALKGPPLTRMSRSIAKKVLSEKVSLILPNILEDAAFKTQDSILSSGIRSAVCAPLWFAPEGGKPEEVIGLVYLDTLVGSHSFSEDDVRILTPLANVAAAKIENVRLLEESLEKRRLEQDMRMAAEIQRSLLPSRPPEVQGYGLAGSNTPCRTVGGDYYDFELQGRSLVLALGDVSGKGTSAALLMTVLRASVRSHWDLPSVAEAMNRINKTVVANSPDNKYVTFFMARVDVASGRMQYVNAGHNAPLLLQGDKVKSLDEGGTVLGMFDEAVYAEGTVDLHPGDVLLVFSDGVTETFAPSGAEFGDEGLVAACAGATQQTADEIQAAILLSLDRFAEGAKPPDDRTLIVLKRLGA
jgi:serine phosphatase RsbU (regulator of sigma subunit)/pSer/pThr/pTyr-binding forkhead associated (FHA) protein